MLRAQADTERRTLPVSHTLDCPVPTTSFHVINSNTPSSGVDSTKVLLNLAHRLSIMKQERWVVNRPCSRAPRLPPWGLFLFCWLARCQGLSSKTKKPTNYPGRFHYWLPGGQVTALQPSVHRRQNRTPFGKRKAPTFRRFSANGQRLLHSLLPPCVTRSLTKRELSDVSSATPSIYQQ
jgi:hypothetical protein